MICKTSQSVMGN